MRVAPLVVASVLSFCPSAFGQDWTEYANRDDGFKVVFPGSPTVTETTFRSEVGADLPARVYSVTRGPERYTVTVADYSQAPRLLDERAKTTCPTDFQDERACGLNLAGRGYWKEDIGGALLWATSCIHRAGCDDHAPGVGVAGSRRRARAAAHRQGRSVPHLRLRHDASEPAVYPRRHGAERLSSAGAVPAVFDGIRGQRRPRRSAINRSIPTCTPNTPTCSPPATPHRPGRRRAGGRAAESPAGRQHRQTREEARVPRRSGAGDRGGAENAELKARGCQRAAEGGVRGTRPRSNKPAGRCSGLFGRGRVPRTSACAQADPLITLVPGAPRERSRARLASAFLCSSARSA